MLQKTRQPLQSTHYFFVWCKGMYLFDNRQNLSIEKVEKVAPTASVCDECRL